MEEKAEIFLRDKGIIYEWTCIDDKIVFESGKLIKLLAEFTETQRQSMPDIVLTQDWSEDEHEKTGWLGSGWNEPQGYELEEVIEQDKYYNHTKAIFKWTK